MGLFGEAAWLHSVSRETRQALFTAAEENGLAGRCLSLGMCHCMT
jgi:hypothetical protein